MSDPSFISDRSSATSFGFGILLGVLLALATSLVFLVIIFGPVLGLALAIAGLRGGSKGRPRANFGSGLLVGMGTVYLLEAINTLTACQGQEVCGGASALPFLGLAVAVLVVGLLLEGIVIARTHFSEGP